jgi:hypothetical protein
MERLAIGRRIVRGALWPTPGEDTPPCERQGPHGSLRVLPLLALLLVIAPCPAGMPEAMPPPTPHTVGGGRARLAGLCGVSGCSLSRWVSRCASGSAASGGSSVARRGEQASRDLARGSGVIGKSPSKAYGRKAETRGPWLSSKAEIQRWVVEPYAAQADPRVNDCGRMRKHAGVSLGRASCLAAASMLGSGPVDPHKGGKGFGGSGRHVPPPRVCESSEKGQASGRAAQD